MEKGDYVELHANENKLADGDIKRVVVVGKTTHSQRIFPRGNFNLCENLNLKNIPSDFIYVEVLIQANIASDAVRKFQHRR